MAYTGKEGREISLEVGADLTSNYRTNNPGAQLGHFFGKDILNEILSQPGCMGIRMYYAEEEDGTKQLVIVGADSSEDDILELIADFSSPCPPCGTSNDLNS